MYETSLFPVLELNGTVYN